jgi:hypothetical protein
LRGKKLATTGNLEGFHLIPRRRFRRRAALRAKLWVTVTRLHVVSVLVAVQWSCLDGGVSVNL